MKGSSQLIGFHWEDGTRSSTVGLINYINKRKGIKTAPIPETTSTTDPSQIGGLGRGTTFSSSHSPLKTKPGQTSGLSGHRYAPYPISGSSRTGVSQSSGSLEDGGGFSGNIHSGPIFSPEERPYVNPEILKYFW